ncbi:MAG: alpha/beta hydrolase [Micrococcales bacterium]|nr:alpha/beta hydrolase [Micrococcales bacterium]
METLLIETAPGVITQTFLHKGGDKLIVWHHGMPSPRPFSPQMADLFKSHGYSVAIPIRQGYAKSSVVGPRPIAKDALVTKAVVNYLGFDEFITTGFSAGGPRALADLALLDNATQGIDFAGLVPANLTDFNPYANAPEDELEFFEIIRKFEPDLIDKFTEWMPGFMAQDPMAEFADADDETKAWANSPDAQFRFAQGAIAFESGAQGWMLDEYSVQVDFGFDVSTITKPLQIITGDADINVDMSCSVWLHSKVKDSTLKVVPGFGHSRIFSLEIIDQALKNL